MAKNEGLNEELLDEAGRRGRNTLDAKTTRDSSGGYTKSTISSVSRIAKGLPQAVLKVTSFSSGRKSVAARLSYVSREGALEFEDQDGNIIEDKQEVLDEWAADFRGGDGVTRKRQPRDTMNLVLSTPKGSDPAASLASARHFLQSEFSPNHSYIFTAHDDTDHYHVHVIVKYRGHDQTLLRANKQDLRQWRDQYAKHCRAQGIKVDASSRWQRGQHFKKAIPQPIYEVEKRGTQQHQDRWRTAPSKKVLQQVQAREKRLIVRNQALQKEYFSMANKLVCAVEQLPPHQQAQVLVESAAIANFASELPKTETNLHKDYKKHLAQLAALAKQPEKLKQLNLEAFKRHAKKVIKQVTITIPAQIERE